MKRAILPESLTSPHWTKTCPRRFMVGLHLPDYDQVPEYETLGIPPILSQFDAKAFVKALKQAHVQVFWFYNKCHLGNSYHPSEVKYAHVHSAMKGRDFFGELTDACLAESIVPGCVYEFSDTRIPKERPEWCHRIPGQQMKGDITDALEGSRVGGPCLNGPYGDYAIAQAVETIRKYPIQGYYVDFLGFFGHENWLCPWCGPLFQKTMGFEFQGIDCLTHEQYVRYLKWKYEQYHNYTQRMVKAIRAIRPNLVFLHNLHAGIVDEANLQTWELASQNCDYLGGDLFQLRKGSLQISWVLRGYAASSHGRPGEVLLDSDTSIGGDAATPKALDGYRAELWTARSTNVAPCASIIMNIDGTFNPETIALVKKVYAEQKSYEQWLKDMEPMATIGILRSQQAIEFRAKEENSCVAPYSHHALEFQGWVQMLIASHYLWDLVQDYQMTMDYLKRFKVLILPNASCLSQAQCDVVEAYVRGGGRVIATGETSLFDENGTARADFALARLLGVSFVGPREMKDMVRAKMKIEDPKLCPREEWMADTTYYVDGQWAVRAADTAEVLGHIFGRTRFTLVASMVPTGLPGLVRQTTGKGRAYYFAGMPGLEYRTWGVNVQRRIMAAVTALETGQTQPVTMEGPMTVELFAHRQSGKSHIVVDLVNNVSGVSRNDGYMTRQKGQLQWGLFRFDDVEQMPPAYGVTVRFRPVNGRTVRRVYLAPARKTLPLRKSNRDVRVTVPVFAVHAMLVAEYE